MAEKKMLVVISDLHLSDGSAGKHCPPAAAFDTLIDDLKAFVNKANPQQITLLLLGDIFDVLRSTKWLEGDNGNEFPVDDRPWGKNGLADIPNPAPKSKTEARCLDILGRWHEDKDNVSNNTILYENWDILKRFREFKNNFPNKETEVIYIPGNHDRLCNLYPAVKNEIAKILYGNVSVPKGSVTINGEWYFDDKYHDSKLGVLARHGHQFDAYNFGETKHLDRSSHLKVSIGDVLTTEFAVRIPWQVEFNNRKKSDGEITNLANRLKDMDNVRPLSAALKWFYYRIRSNSVGTVRKSLDEAFDDMAANMINLDFAQKWNSPHTNLDEVARLATNPWVKWISKKVLTGLDMETLLPAFLKTTDGNEDCYLEGAYSDMRNHPNARIIIYGHTHNPFQQPLDVDVVSNADFHYLNSGTWRNRVIETASYDKSPDFVNIQAMTYITVYHNDNSLVSYDMWTGARK